MRPCDCDVDLAVFGHTWCPEAPPSPSFELGGRCTAAERARAGVAPW